MLACKAATGFCAGTLAGLVWAACEWWFPGAIAFFCVIGAHASGYIDAQTQETLIDVIEDATEVEPYPKLRRNPRY